MPPRIGPLRFVNGEFTTEDIEMAQVLNNYFASVFTAQNTNGIEEMSAL